MKKIVKKIASTICFVIAFPFYMFYRLESFLLKTEQPFCGMSQFVSLFPGIGGEYLRREFYKLSLKSCSDDCCISFGTIFSHPGVEIGKGVYIGAYCTIGLVSLGDNVLLGSNVDITSGRRQHCFDSTDKPIRQQGRVFQRVYIGQDSWIGNGVIVTADIGTKCIVGAGSVVVKQIDDLGVAVGNPARVIKYINDK